MNNILKKKIIIIFFIISFLYIYQHIFDILILFHFNLNNVLFFEIICLFFIYIYIYFLFFPKNIIGFFFKLFIFLLGNGIFFFLLMLNINQFF